ncbi:two-partner secretion domain-containing protein [Chlorogloea sp. CCALA 695]|nr:hypothetical protein C7B70_18090 [Chlorogloea sp. CCALA 695]
MSTNAQIIPDNTLGSESSIIAPNTNEINNQIYGGAIRGSTLFHSFQEFNVGKGKGVYFINPTGIENILSRVTGENPSSILGTLGVQGGNANLFMINPRGIIFGPDANLNINGSFLGTTANSIILSNGTQFQARDPQSVPLLSIQVPIGLSFDGNPAPITVQGTGHNLSLFFPLAGSPILGSGESLNGLRTDPGKTIALVGGDINFDGGVLTASSGQINIGSINTGIVSVNSNTFGIFLNYDSIASFQNIELNKQALLDASGFINGNIHLQAKNIALTNGAFILTSNFGSNDAGTVTLNATENITINRNLLTLGNFIPGFLGAGIVTQNFSTGKGADINISARELNIQTAFGIVTETYDQGQGGNINLDISGKHIQNLEKLEPQVSVDRGLIATFVSGSANGKAGNLTLSTSNVYIKNGGTIASETFGLGNGGDVNIQASGKIKVSGAVQFTSNSFLPSFLGALATSEGNAGNVKINTENLVIEDGGRIDSVTLASGSAGRVTITANDSIDVIGRVPGSLNPTLISSSANRLDPAFTPFYGLSSTLDGNSSSVEIFTNQLNISDGARISVRNDGSGEAGDIKITANSINLKNQGAIVADTGVKDGGNIFLKADNLQLRQNSEINATAGGNSTGGNISIDTHLLVALENSKITANAFEGNGGNIQVSTQGLFISPDSKITASSNLGIDGVVNIQTLEFDERNNLTPLENTFVGSEQVIANTCLTRRNKQAGSFVVTGTGGLPDKPESTTNSYDSLTTSDNSKVEVSLAPPVVNTISTKTWQPGDRIVDSNTLVKTADGQILLVAQQPNVQNVKSLVCTLEN